MKAEFKKSYAIILTLVLCGFLSGIVNSLIGTGGGIIITFVLSKLYAENPDYSTKDIFSTVLASVAIMSAGTSIIYIMKKMVTLSEALPFMLPAVIGGIAGAFLLDRLNSKIFKKLFALLVIWAGISMVMK